MQSPTSITIIALLMTIPGAILAFRYLRPTYAVLAVFLGGILFLPEKVALDPPLLPPFDKHSIPALCLLVGVVIKARQRVTEARIGRGIDLFLVIGALGILGTVFTNGDAQRFGKTILPGLTSGDAVSYVSNFIFTQGIPFVVGRIMFRSADDARDLLRAIVIGGLVYTPFVLIELRMSPQFHTWVYGYMQHDYLQTIRAGGWRPMCFMAHGLALGMFICAASLCAWQLAKARQRVFGYSAMPIAIGLTVLLAFLNSVGALVYGLVAILITWFCKPRTQLAVAAGLALVIAIYPNLRWTGTFPARDLVDFFATFSQERAASLAVRFTNEDDLLLRAMERPWFGWGGWGRNFVYSPYGQTFSIVDGAWIAYVGAWGFVGFAARFGLLLVPIFIAYRNSKTFRPEDQTLLGSVALVATFYALDLLPNGTYNHMPSLLSGAVLGLAVGMPQHSRANPAAAALVRLLLQRKVRAPSPAPALPP